MSGFYFPSFFYLTRVQTSWRCFAVENPDSSTYKMFVRKKPLSSIHTASSPKEKKTVCRKDYFYLADLPLTLPLFRSQSDFKS